MADENGIIHVEQDGHPDGAIFGVVNLAKPMAIHPTVLCIEQSHAKSLHRGLQCVLDYDRVAHPHVWPWPPRPKTVQLVGGKVVPLVTGG